MQKAKSCKQSYQSTVTKNKPLLSNKKKNKQSPTRKFTTTKNNHSTISLQRRRFTTTQLQYNNSPMNQSDDGAITIPVLVLPHHSKLDNAKLLEDKNSMFNRTAEGNFTTSNEVYTADEIAEFERQMEEEHKGSVMTGFYREKIEKTNHWNTFYKNNKNNFFKDRHYFHREIPTLVERYDDYTEYIKAHHKFQASPFNTTSSTMIDTPNNSPTTTTQPILSITTSITIPSGDEMIKFNEYFTPQERSYLLEKPRQPLTMAEVGCGVGNTFFPITEDLPLLHVIGCDISANAINIIKQSAQYDPATIDVSVCDIGKAILPFEDNSAEFVTLIYTLSALSPSQFHHVLTECYRIMKPDGVFYIRDYAIWDLTMRRFKKGQRLEQDEPLFVRGDGTKTYFFERQKLINWLNDAGIYVKDGAESEDVKYIKKTVENRKLEIEMERRWIYASGTKIPSLLTPSHECKCPSHLEKEQKVE